MVGGGELLTEISH